jgi:hypothetical protein
MTSRSRSRAWAISACRLDGWWWRRTSLIDVDPLGRDQYRLLNRAGNAVLGALPEPDGAFVWYLRHPFSYFLVLNGRFSCLRE